MKNLYLLASRLEKYIFTFLLLTTITSLEAQTITSGLVRYYKLTDNPNDATSNGNNGTVNGATSTTNSFGNVINDITALYTINDCTAGTWLGTISSDWNDANNWCGGVPTASTDVVIPSGTTHAPIINSSATVKNITINTGANLSFSGSNGLSVTGNFINNGTFNAGTGTVEFNGTAAQNIPSLNYYNLTLNNTAWAYLPLNSHVNGIDGTSVIKISGTYIRNSQVWDRDAFGGAIIEFNGNGAQTVPAYSYYHLKISGNRNGSVTLAPGDIIVSGDLSATASFTAGNYIVTNNRVRFQNGWYAQRKISGAPTFNNLDLISGEGYNNYSFGSSVITVKGNLYYAFPTATMDPGTSTILFNGATQQQINGDLALNFYNVTIDNSAGIVLNKDVTISGGSNALTYVKGKINTGNNILTLGAEAVVTGAGFPDKYVNGNLRKVIKTGTISPIFHIGDATGFAPVIVTFPNGSTNGTGTITASTSVAAPPLASGISQSKYVNRKWKLINDGVTFSTYDPFFYFQSTDLVGSPNTGKFIVTKLESGVWSSVTTGQKLSFGTFASGIGSLTTAEFAIGEPACTILTWYQDEDNDGYAKAIIATCFQPQGNGWTTIKKPIGDCNDNDINIYPNAPEVCDGKDNDCNGITDTGEPELWTWMTGKATSNQSPVYGVKGVTSNLNTPGSRTSAAGWNIGGGKLLLFGGINTSTAGPARLNDLWQYDIASNEWTWIHGNKNVNDPGEYGTKGLESSNNMPSARSGAQAWFGLDGSVWLFGGSTASGTLNDLWKYSPATNEWTWVSGDNTLNQGGSFGIKGTPSTTSKPGSRNLSTGWVDTEGQLWLYGGFGVAGSSGGWLNDLWKFNPATNEWTWVNGNSLFNQLAVYGTKGTASTINTPGGRQSPVTWNDQDGNVWFFSGGGSTDGTNRARLFNDLWKYDPQTNLWTWISGDNVIEQPGIYGAKNIETSSNKPGARLASSGWLDGTGNLVLMGGSGYSEGATSGGALNDIWMFNLKTNNWSWIGGDKSSNSSGEYGTQGVGLSSNIPPAMLSSTVIQDEHNNVWLYGGSGLGGFRESLWLYTRMKPYFKDNDGDRFGNSANRILSCLQPAGYVTNNSDCNDNDALVNPATLWYLDKDGDGYSTGDPVLSCVKPEGNYKNSGIIAFEDCNDEPIKGERINKGAIEFCNGIDDDCNGKVDDGLIDTDKDGIKDECDPDNDNDGVADINDCAPLNPAISSSKPYYADADGDGYGTGPVVLFCSLTAPEGYSINNFDWDDNPKNPDKEPQVMMCHKGQSSSVNERDVLKKLEQGWTMGGCTTSNCKPNEETLMCRDGLPECVKNKDVNKHLADKKNRWTLGSCTTAPQSITAASLRSFENQHTEPVINGLTIKAFPNPSIGKFNLTVKSNSSETVQLKVFDVVGREVYTANGSANATYQFGQNFSKGNYLIKVLQKDKQATLKLTKQ